MQGCQRTIYLCDDGKDANKETWVEGLNRTGAAGCPVVYIRGHPRAPGEVNGKSGNLNNALSNVLYPGGVDPGSHEVPPTLTLTPPVPAAPEVLPAAILFWTPACRSGCC